MFLTGKIVLINHSIFAGKREESLINLRLPIHTIWPETSIFLPPLCRKRRPRRNRTRGAHSPKFNLRMSLLPRPLIFRCSQAKIMTLAKLFFQGGGMPPQGEFILTVVTNFGGILLKD